MSLVTEEQAAKVWCPATMNQDQPDGCCGSRCMAWRGAKTKFMVVFDGRPEVEYGWNPRTQASKDQQHLYQVREVKLGFCGLAGRP